MKKVKLSQILQYLSDDTLIQIAICGHDEVEEFNADSVFIKPYYDYDIEKIEGTESFIEDMPIIKVSIKVDMPMDDCQLNAA